MLERRLNRMRWAGQIATLIGLTILLASCNATTAGIDPCRGREIILVSRQDVLTQGTARQILRVNRRTEELGCR